MPQNSLMGVSAPLHFLSFPLGSGIHLSSHHYGLISLLGWKSMFPALMSNSWNPLTWAAISILWLHESYFVFQGYQRGGVATSSSKSCRKQQLLSWVSIYSTGKHDFARATFKLSYLYPTPKTSFLPGAPACLVPNTGFWPKQEAGDGAASETFLGDAGLAAHVP